MEKVQGSPRQPCWRQAPRSQRPAPTKKRRERSGDSSTSPQLRRASSANHSMLATLQDRERGTRGGQRLHSSSGRLIAPRGAATSTLRSPVRRAAPTRRPPVVKFSARLGQRLAALQRHQAGDVVPGGGHMLVPAARADQSGDSQRLATAHIRLHNSSTHPLAAGRRRGTSHTFGVGDHAGRASQHSSGLIGGWWCSSGEDKSAAQVSCHTPERQEHSPQCCSKGAPNRQRNPPPQYPRPLLGWPSCPRLKLRSGGRHCRSRFIGAAVRHTSNRFAGGRVQHLSQDRTGVGVRWRSLQPGHTWHSICMGASSALIGSLQHKWH